MAEKSSSSFLEKDDEGEEEEGEEEEGEEEEEEEEEEEAKPATGSGKYGPVVTSPPSLAKTKSISATRSSLGGGEAEDGAYVLEMVREGKNAVSRLTPRSVEAMTREGYTREELVTRPLESFRGGKQEMVRERHAKLRHKRHEEGRLQKLGTVEATREKLVAEGWPPTEEETRAAAADSGMVAKMKARTEKQEKAFLRRGERTEEMARQRGEMEEFAKARSQNHDMRKKLMDEARQATLDGRADAELAKREGRLQRVTANQEANEKEAFRRQQEADAREEARDERLERERKEAAERREAEAEAKRAKIAKALADETAALNERRAATTRQVMRDKQRMEELEEAREQRRLEAVRRGLAKFREVEQSQFELEGMIDLAAARTMVRLQGAETQAAQEAQRQAQLAEKHARLQAKADQRERGKAAAEAREQNRVRTTMETQEAAEERRQNELERRAEERADRKEEQRHRMQQKLDAVERLRKQKEWEAKERDRQFKADDAVYFHQKETLEKMRKERMAANHVQAEKQAKQAQGEKMSTTSMAPGPAQFDNRFFGTGTKSIATAGKPKRSAPQYSFGNLSELAAPRFLDKGMEVELLGRDSPGPATAHSAIGSVGGPIEKTTLARRVPAYGFGNATGARFKEPKGTDQSPNPTTYDVSKRIMEFTRMRSTPAFAFASPAEKELFRSHSAASTHGLVGLLHPSRTPGPGSYLVKNVVEGCSGNVVQPRTTYLYSFGNTKRFHSHDTNLKNPGPQKYSPSKSFCSKSLAL